MIYKIHKWNICFRIRMENILKENLTGIIYSYLVVIAIVLRTRKYDEGIIDCCKDDPEKLLTFRINENAVEIEKKEEKEDKTLDRTIELLQEVYGIDNTGMREYKSDMRFKGVLRQMNLLYDNLEQLKENPDSKMVQRKLKVLLRRESAFAAFKRCYIEEHKDIYPGLQKYLE